MTAKKPEPTPLTLLCPIKNGNNGNQSYASLTRQYLQTIDDNERSPFARIPNTLLCRFYILNDVFFEGFPAHDEHLKSKYLVFCCNFSGARDIYLRQLWQREESFAREVWQHCVGFEHVKTEQDFLEYIQRCTVETTFYFNGSSGAPLAEQLKALYLKQELSHFVCDQQHASAEDLLNAFRQFVARTQPEDLTHPTWNAGQTWV